MALVARRRAAGRKMAFSQVGLVVLLISIAVHGAQLWLQTSYPLLLATNIVLLFYMRWEANSQLQRRRADFDPVIAAEMMVAFGVLSLILGIAAAVAPLFLGTASLRVNDLSALGILAVPFLEGLATAGLAPFFAVVLRIEAHEAATSADASADMTTLATVTHDLGLELKGTLRVVGDLREQLRFAASASQTLGQQMQAEASRLGAMVSQGEAQLKLLSGAAETSSKEVARLASETSQLSAAAKETGTMLNALGDLIESVERFVKPAEPAE
ncbi:hypothetical protein [Sphingomonas sp.]|uniref:hypothetical protein n=1 Tax=Sphingomonas sp. TaxID=28214 RepID=UPI001D44E63C|nr:hypothetical protein [Sphingomonas sp.]MBX9797599.1 hypothetical protein [Sphingomonas sp.]